MEIIRVKLKTLTLNITDGEHGSVIDDNLGKYYLLSNKNIISDRIVYGKEDRKISKESFEKINRRTKLSLGDVLLSTVGTIGKSAIIKDKVLNYDFQRSVGIIKCDTEKLTPEYLHNYFKLNYVQKKLKMLSKGAIQKCLFISDLADLDIELPKKIEDQQKIINGLRHIDKRIEVNLDMNRELENLKETIFVSSFFNYKNKLLFDN